MGYVIRGIKHVIELLKGAEGWGGDVDYLSYFRSDRQSEARKATIEISQHSDSIAVLKFLKKIKCRARSGEGTKSSIFVLSAAETRPPEITATPNSAKYSEGIMKVLGSRELLDRLTKF